MFDAALDAEAAEPTSCLWFYGGNACDWPLCDSCRRCGTHRVNVHTKSLRVSVAA